MAIYNTQTGLEAEAVAIQNETQKKAITAFRNGRLLLGIIQYFGVQLRNIIAVSKDATVATSANVVITQDATNFKFLKSDFPSVLVVDNIIFAKNQTTESEAGLYQITLVDDTYYTTIKTQNANKLNKVYVAQGVNEGCWHRDGNGITTPFVRIQNGDYYDAAHVTNPAFDDIASTNVAGQLTEINDKANTNANDIDTLNTQMGDVSAALTTINNALALI